MTPNYPPLLYSLPVTQGIAGQPYRYAAKAADPNQDRVIYSLTLAPPGMTIESDAGLIEWIPGQAGTYSVEVVADDGMGEQDSQEFSILVQAPAIDNRRPRITSPALTSAVEYALYLY
ncbi:MAG: hypothetical protein GY703_23250 [Gammaproteobacteria bacterium]|nr:hypothetical protein [Gammaproteobacteria bacterium]